MITIYGRVERAFHATKFIPKIFDKILNNWENTGMVRKINGNVMIHQDVLYYAIGMIPQEKKLITKLN